MKVKSLTHMSFESVKVFLSFKFCGNTLGPLSGTDSQSSWAYRRSHQVTVRRSKKMVPAVPWGERCAVKVCSFMELYRNSRVDWAVGLHFVMIKREHVVI